MVNIHRSERSKAPSASKEITNPGSIVGLGVPSAIVGVLEEVSVTLKLMSIYTSARTGMFRARVGEPTLQATQALPCW
eukprot:918078-Amphidinium_carterae.1